MKSIFYSLIIFSLCFSACSYVDSAKEQLTFLMKMSSKYGGQWNGSAAGNTYSIAITNSTRINEENKDSLEYFGVAIGRAFIEEIGENYSVLNLEIVDKTQVAVVSTSKSFSHSFDLGLIKRFKAFDIEEFMVIRDAFYAARYADAGNLEDAENIIYHLDTTGVGEHPYVQLAKAHVERQKGFDEDSEKIVQALAETDTQDDLFYQYIGLYYSSVEAYEKSLPFFRKAVELAAYNTEHWMNMGLMNFHLEKYDSSVSFFTKAIGVDSTHLNAYFCRAESQLKRNKKKLACHDIQKILEISPGIELPDSMLVICNLNTN